MSFAGTAFSPTYKSFNYTGSVGNEATGGHGTENATTTMSGPFIPASSSHSYKSLEHPKSLEQNTIPVFNFSDISQKVLKNGFVLAFDLGDEDIPFIRRSHESDPEATTKVSVEDNKRETHDKEAKEDDENGYSEKWHPKVVLGSSTDDLFSYCDANDKLEDEVRDQVEEEKKRVVDREDSSADIDTLPLPPEVIENYYSSNTPLQPNLQNPQNPPQNEEISSRPNLNRRFRYEPPPTNNGALLLKWTMSLSQPDSLLNTANTTSTSKPNAESPESQSSSFGSESFSFSVPSFNTVPTSNSNPPTTSTESPVLVDTSSHSTLNAQLSASIPSKESPPKENIAVAAPTPKKATSTKLPAPGAAQHSASTPKGDIPVSDSVAEFQHVFYHSRPLKTYQRRTPKLNVKVQTHTGTSSIKDPQSPVKSNKVKFNEAVDVCHLSQTSNSAQHYSPSPPIPAPSRTSPLPTPPTTTDTAGKSFRKAAPVTQQPATPSTPAQKSPQLATQTSDLGFHHFTKHSPTLPHSTSFPSTLSLLQPLTIPSLHPPKSVTPPARTPVPPPAPTMKPKDVKKSGEEKRPTEDAHKRQGTEVEEKRTRHEKPKRKDTESESDSLEEGPKKGKKFGNRTETDENTEVNKKKASATLGKTKTRSSLDYREERTEGDAKRKKVDGRNHKRSSLDDEEVYEDKKAKKSTARTRKQSSLEDEGEEGDKKRKQSSSKPKKRRSVEDREEVEDKKKRPEDEEEGDDPTQKQKKPRPASTTTRNKAANKTVSDKREKTTKHKLDDTTSSIEKEVSLEIEEDGSLEKRVLKRLSKKRKSDDEGEPKPRSRETKRTSKHMKKESDEEISSSTSNSPEEGVKHPRSKEDEDNTDDMHSKYSKIADSPHSVSKRGPLFSGFIFIVTGIKKSKRMTVQRLKELIRANGGKLIDDVIHIPISPIKRIYKKGVPKTILLSDRDRKTIKYVLGLASGTPCLHYNWLSHCLEKRAILPYEPYLLPDGFSTSKNCLIQREGIPYQNYVFDGCRIELFGPLSWQEQWSRVLKEAGAKIVKRLFSESADRLDYVLSNCPPEKEIKDRAASMGLSIASVMWVVECVLVQELLPLDAEGYTY